MARISAAVPPPAAPACSSQSLWDQALDRLEEKDKVCIQSKAATSIDGLLESIKAQHRESKDKRLEAKGTNGKTVVLYEAFDKIMKWVQKFVSVGDVMVQYDPGHTALPWAALRFILQACINDYENCVVVLEGTEDIAGIIALNRIHEASDLSHSDHDTELLKQRLVLVYVSILSFFAKTIRFYERNRARRIMGSLLPSSEKYQKRLSDIKNRQADVEKFSTLIVRENQNIKLNSILQGLEEVKIRLPPASSQDIEMPQGLGQTPKGLQMLNLEAEQDDRNVFFNVPGLVKSPYVGRQDVGTRLEEAFRDSSNKATELNPKAFVITGIGGIGKSEVCKKFAFDHRREYWGIFWVNVGDQDIEEAQQVPSSSAEKDFVAIGKLCGIIDPSFESARLELSNTSQKWLLILDNADGKEVDYSEYFPSGKYGHIILTSRNAECAGLSSVGHEQLTHLSPKVAQNLLLRCSGISESEWEDSRAAAENVADLLGLHTLALVLAGAYVRLKKCTLEQYPLEFAEIPEQLLKFKSSQWKSRYGSLHETFEVTAKYLSSRQDEEEYIDALQLLDILAFLDFLDISETLFEEASAYASSMASERRTRPEDEMSTLSQIHANLIPAWMRTSKKKSFSSRRWRSACSLLESLAIINTFADGNQLHISVHPLIRYWLQYRQNETQQLENWLVASSVLALATKETVFMQPFLRPLQPHILCCMEYALAHFDESEVFNQSPNICQIQQVLLRFQWILIHMKNAKSIRRILTWLRSEISKNQTSAVDRLGFREQFKAIEHFMNGQYKEHLQLMRSIVTIREKELDHNNPYMFDAWYDLVKSHLRNHNFKEAENLVQKILDEKGVSLENLEELNISEEERASYISLLDNKVRAYEGQGRHGEAENLLEKVVSKQEVVLGEDHPISIGFQRHLVQVYFGRKKHQAAAILLEKIIQKLTKLPSEYDLDLTKFRRMLAQAYRVLGKTSTAFSLLEQNIRMMDTFKFQAKWPDDCQQELAWSQSLLAQIYIQDGRNQEAIQLLETSLITLKTHSSTRPDIVFILKKDLLAAYVKSNQKEEAENLLAELDSRPLLLVDYPQLKRHKKDIDRARKALQPPDQINRKVQVSPRRRNKGKASLTKHQHEANVPN